jgi:oleate hydratase
MAIEEKNNGQVWLAGGGIAAMAAAVFLIRDAGVPGEKIHILEATNLAGGALDGAPSPVQSGYVTRGGRMLEEEAYQTLWNLLSTIPSLEDNGVTVRQEILDFNKRVKTESHARLVDRDHSFINAAEYGFNSRDRLELVRLLATTESKLGSRRIDELFSEHFFGTNFWQMWRTTFAFQNWHSAMELRRYFLRFIQEFPRIHTLSGVRRTKYNQYDSIVRPIQRWLAERKVDVRFGHTVRDIDFDNYSPKRRATAIHITTAGGDETISVGSEDRVLITLGSLTADATYGGNEDVPPLVRDRKDGAWSLWEKIAQKDGRFGRPATFFGNIDDHKWESFTLTMHGGVLLKRLVDYSRNEPGTGALMTFVHSGWLLSIVVPYQPHFPGMHRDEYTLWGYGLFVDKPGDYVKKPMAQCTGKEILIELIHQLGFGEMMAEILETTDVTTVMMPYASSMFACRSTDDRPLVVPEGAENFAFLGQYTELPEDVVFTVEYPVHSAMHAVYQLFHVDKKIPPVYHGLLDPAVGIKALEAAFH